MSAWVTKASLGNICEILDKKRKPITKRNRKPGPYPYYGATGVLDHVDSYIFNESLVLIGEDGAKWGAGEKTAYAVEGKCWVNNHAHVIRPNRKVILDNWLIYYLNAIDLSEYTTGLTVPKLNQAKLREIPIPMPAIREQKRIVAILDEAFSGIEKVIANTEKNLANAREIFKSYLNNIFNYQENSWIEKAFDDLVKEKIVGMVRSNRLQSDNLPYPYVKMNNITRNNRFDFRNFNSVDANCDEVEKFSLENGDFLFNTRNSVELVGKACIYESNTDNAVLFNNNLMRIRFRAVIEPKFILYFFSSKVGSEGLNKLKSGTTNVAAIYYKDLKLFPIPTPPLKVQRKFISILDELDYEIQNLETIYQQKLTALTELKQSLLQKAFSGELTAEKTDNEMQRAVA